MAKDVLSGLFIRCFGEAFTLGGKWDRGLTGRGGTVTPGPFPLVLLLSFLPSNMGYTSTSHMKHFLLFKYQIKKKHQKLKSGDKKNCQF